MRRCATKYATTTHRASRALFYWLFAFPVCSLSYGENFRFQWIQLFAEPATQLGERG
jgi:hypothetical protein